MGCKSKTSRGGGGGGGGEGGGGGGRRRLVVQVVVKVEELLFDPLLNAKQSHQKRERKEGEENLRKMRPE